MGFEKFDTVKVTMEVTYLVPKGLNGWSLDESLKDWFETNNVNSHHATRDAYELGGSKKILKIELVGELEL